MPEPTSRRGFLRGLVRGAGEAIVEFTDGGDDRPRRDRDREGDASAAAAAAPLLTQAEPVTRSLTVEEMLEIAEEEGLAHRFDDLRRIARPSPRLIPATDAADGDPARSQIGRPPATARLDGTVAAVIDLDLTDSALTGCGLPGTGRLTVSIVVPRRAPIAPCSRAQVAVDAAAVDAGVEAVPVRLSTELTLPRVWAAPVRALDLDGDEHTAYVTLRERVANLQGVTAEDGDAEGVARHHLLGYPTETSGSMPLVCELASRGLDPETPPTEVEADVVEAAARWCLLLQVTQDERGGVVLGSGVARLFFWVDREDLERQDLSEVWAIAR